MNNWFLMNAEMQMWCKCFSLYIVVEKHIKTLSNPNDISSMNNTQTKRSVVYWVRFFNFLLLSILCDKTKECWNSRLLQEISCGISTIAHILFLATASLCCGKFCIKEMSFLCKLHTFVLYLKECFDALLGPSELNPCATIRRANAIMVNEKSLKAHGMNLQFFMDCSEPGDTIIFDTKVVEPQNTTVVMHPVVFDVASPNASRVTLKCPRVGMIFDIR